MSNRLQYVRRIADVGFRRAGSSEFPCFDMARIPATGYYVYALVGLDGEPFYIGKGKDLRWMFHEKSVRRGVHPNSSLDKIVRQCIEAIGFCEVVCIKDGLDENQAFALESFLIDNLVGLCNGVAGKRTEAQIALAKAESLPDVAIDDLFAMVDGVWCKAHDYHEKINLYIRKRDSLNHYAPIVNNQQLGCWE